MNDVKRFAAVGMLGMGMLCVGCTDAGKTAVSSTVEAPKAAKPEAVAAKSVISPMYTAAVRWAPDAQLIRLAAKEIPGYKSGAGKASLWEGSFGSAQKRQFQVFTDAIATVLPEYHKGVEIGRAKPWAGVSLNEMPIETAAVMVDSDAAYAAAAADAAEWLKKNPEKTLTSIELGKVAKFAAPVWYVQWGDKKAGYVALVDAGSGKVIKK